MYVKGCNRYTGDYPLVLHMKVSNYCFKFLIFPVLVGIYIITI